MEFDLNIFALVWMSSPIFILGFIVFEFSQKVKALSTEEACSICNDYEYEGSCGC